MKTFESFTTVSKLDAAARSIAADITNIIKRFPGKVQLDLSLDYTRLANLIVHLRVTRGRLPSGSTAWEKLNFKRHGFALDANTYVPQAGHPGTNIDLVISPEAEPACLGPLEYSMIDTIRHELEHAQHRAKPNSLNRRSSDQSYQYFLLDDEMPAMIAGLALAAEQEGTSLQTAISAYLTPFVESGFMTVDEFDKVIQVWLDYANSH